MNGVHLTFAHAYRWTANGDECVDVTKCPSEATVLATDAAVRYERWEAPLIGGKCSTGCHFNYCGKAFDMPCCIKEDATSSRQCPLRATVMMTGKEKRWKLWEDKQCVSGCMLDACGEEGEADVPCCVRSLPYSEGAKARSPAKVPFDGVIATS